MISQTGDYAKKKRLRIGFDHPEKILLSDLLLYQRDATCRFFTGGQASNLGQGFIEAMIGIDEGKKVELIDDLHMHGVTSFVVDFVIYENAHLSYRLQVTEGIEELAYPRLEQQPVVICDRDVTVTFIGADAHADVTCLYFGQGDQVFKIRTTQNHRAQRTTSTLLVKSVLTDKAQLLCRSLVHLNDQAQHAVANQMNKNILLSPHARATAIPMMEVLADEVKCTHGSAVSKIDEEQLFYAASRGLSVQQVELMLVRGFLLGNES